MNLIGNLQVDEKGLRFFPKKLIGYSSTYFELLKIPKISEKFSVEIDNSFYPFFAFSVLLYRKFPNVAEPVIEDLRSTERISLKKRAYYNNVKLYPDGLEINGRKISFEEFIKEHYNNVIGIESMIKTLEKYLKVERVYGYKNFSIIYSSKEKGSPILVIMGNRIYIGCYLGKIEMVRGNNVWITNKEVPLVIEMRKDKLENNILSPFPFAHPHVERTDYFAYVCGDTVKRQIIEKKLVPEHNNIKVEDIFKEFKEMVEKRVENNFARKVLKLEEILELIAGYLGRDVPDLISGNTIDFGYPKRENPDELREICLKNNKKFLGKTIKESDPRFCRDPQNAIILVRK